MFFKPTALIEYVKGHHVHVFECNTKHCKGKGNGHFVRRYLVTSDAKSTSNLCKHAKICFGEEEVASADKTQDVHVAREVLKNRKDGSTFEHVAKSKVTYSHHQHTTTKSQCISIP